MVLGLPYLVRGLPYMALGLPYLVREKQLTDIRLSIKIEFKFPVTLSKVEFRR